MRSFAIAALAFALVGVPGSAHAASAAAPRPDRVVAAAWVEGAFTIPGTLGYRVPVFSLYADGRLLTSGDPDDHDVPTYRIARLSPSGALGLRRSFFDATHNVDFGFVPVADVGYTRTRAHFQGGVAWQRINALGMDTGLSSAQRQARLRLQAVIDQALAIPAHSFSPRHYEVRRIQIGDASAQIEWPGPDLPVGDCGQLSAASYDRFPDDFQQGRAYTWQGESFALWLRPLAPGDTGCRGL